MKLPFRRGANDEQTPPPNPSSLTSGADQPQPDDDPRSRMTPEQRQRARRAYVEELINNARDRGEFDNLEGAGKPLRLDTNIYAGEKALAYSLLKNNDLAPAEIERGKEIDADLHRADALLATLRHRRDTLRLRTTSAFVSERRAYNVLRDKTEGRYRELLRAANSNVLSLNIIAPPALHRRQVDVEARMRAFAEEFPRLPE